MRPSLPPVAWSQRSYARVRGQLTVMIRGESEPYHLLHPFRLYDVCRPRDPPAHDADNGTGLKELKLERRRKAESEVGDVSHRSVACRYAAKAHRRSRRLRRRHALSARHRGPAV